MTRRESRETVFCLLYEVEFHRDTHYLDVYNLAKYTREIKENEYIKSTYIGVCEHRDEIDAHIGKAAVNWRVERMSGVTRAILRLCVYEMLFGDTPPRVAINEAVELAKKFDTDTAPAFVNGILNKIARENALITEDVPVSEDDISDDEPDVPDGETGSDE